MHMDRLRHGEVAEAAAAGRTTCADSEVDLAGVSLVRRPAATTATAVLAAQRGKQNSCIFFRTFFFQEKNCVWRKILKFISELSLKIQHKLCLTRCK
jgi:hypothetical protein